MINYIKEINDVRKHYGYKAKELCKKAELNEGYIASINHHKTKYPAIDCLLALARVLNYDRIRNYETFYDLRIKLGENIIVDFMETIDRRKGD